MGSLESSSSVEKVIEKILLNSQFFEELSRFKILGNILGFVKFCEP